VLSESGAIFCSTNQRALTAAGFRRLIMSGLAKAGAWRMEERRMPGDFTGEQYLKACWVERR
jgi:23S rRNA G2069 N7-methylase RlmK/C1962 C5-methylase RlmI